MNLWPVEHFFPHFLDRFAVCSSKPVQKVRKKVFNWSEVHLYWSNFLQDPYFSTQDSTVSLTILNLSLSIQTIIMCYVDDLSARPVICAVYCVGFEKHHNFAENNNLFWLRHVETP